MKYYFITYQAKNGGSISVWNSVINKTPMDFLTELFDDEDVSGYYSFSITFSMEITREEYEKHEGNF